MKLNEFIYMQMLAGGKWGYWAILKAVSFGVLAMLFKPGRFEKNGEIVENLVENGAFRVFLGGFFMVFVGFWLIVTGFVASAALLLIFASTPLVAAYILVYARVNAWLRNRAVKRTVEAVAKATNRGA